MPVDRVVLPNGLVLLTCPDTTVPNITYQTFVDAGSRDETLSGYTGIMRLLGVIANRMPDAVLGRYLNQLPNFVPSLVEVGEDYTIFDTGCLPGHLEELMSLEAERITTVPLTREEVERAIASSLERRELQIDSIPEAFLRQELLRNTFRRHTYRHPILGWESDLRRGAIYGELKRLCHVYYRPNYTTIVIYGNFDPDRAAELILQYYGEWKPALPPTSQVLFESTQTSRVTRKFDWPDSSISLLAAIGYRIPDFNLDQPDLVAMQLLSRILFAPEGYIHRVFVKSGIDCGIRYDIEGKKDPYLVSIELINQDTLSTENIIELFDSAVASFSKSDIDDSELAAAREYIHRKVTDRLAQPFGIGRLIGQFQLVGGDYRMINHYVTMIDSVPKSDPITARDKYLQKKASTVVFLNPR